MAPLGKAFIVVGLLLTLFGLALLCADSLPILGRLGRMPGDIYIRRGNFAFYLPITTAIVLSVIVSLLIALLRR